MDDACGGSCWTSLAARRREEMEAGCSPCVLEAAVYQQSGGESPVRCRW